jgi:hypothetical protein
MHCRAVAKWYGVGTQTETASVFLRNSSIEAQTSAPFWAATASAAAWSRS